MTREAGRRSFPIAILVFLWNFITGVRTAFFNILFLLFVLVILLAIFGSKEEPLPDRAPLLVSLSGNLVDQYTYLSPEDRLLNPAQSEQGEILVRDLVQTIKFASHDSRITGLLLHLDHMQGSGLTKLRELGEAIDQFKESGKPVIAIADSFNQDQYYLATYADEIVMHPLGNIAITGYGMYRNYYKEALDKLAVNFHVFKVGQFKDFVEPYIRNSMSDASREHNSQWLSELWGTYATHVETRRDMAEGSLNEWINHMADHLAKFEGDISKMAVNLNLVDYSLSRVERRQKLIDQFGHVKNKPDELKYVSYAQYKNHALKQHDLFEQANIALVVAKGTILDGTQPEGSIGGDSLSQLLRNVGKDENIKALVLRIDSGGGSAFASELIRQELQALRDKGITIVTSMGSVAASGGYWIAMASDEIWATPTTITGSIGVFGLFPTVEKSLEKVGVHSDGFGTTNLAGALRIDRPLSREAGNVIQQGVENIYDRFLEIVAINRQSTPEKIHQVAQGRVWSGAQAKELGLIDQLGYLEDAITAAATRAELSEYKVKLFERELSPQEAFLKELMQNASVTTDLETLLAQWSGMDLSSLKIFMDAAKQQSKGDLNAARATYATCLACFAP